jgi:prophage regulatory protein
VSTYLSSFRILSVRQVSEVIGLSRATIWRLGRRGDFPKAVALSPGRVGWPEHAVRAWLQQRMEAASQTE